MFVNPLSIQSRRSRKGRAHLWTTLALACLVLATASAQETPTQQDRPVTDVSAPAITGGPAEDQTASIFGEPLIVNGKRISDMEIKRFLCYGKGRLGLESLRLGMLMDQERELRRIKQTERVLEEEFGGRTVEELTDVQRTELEQAVDSFMARFVLDPGEFEVRLAKEMESFQSRYPTLDLKTEIERAYQSMDWWQDQIRMTLEFDQLFFPDHPDGWPELSIEAIHQASPQIDLVADYQKYYELRRDQWMERRSQAEAAALAEHFDGKPAEELTEEQRTRLAGMVDEEAGKFMPREDDMMMALLRDAVQGILNDFVTLKTASDGLPPHLLMTIEGNGLSAELTTEQVYQDMKEAFNEHDIYEAKLFLALMAATKDRLAAENKLKPELPFREELAEQKAASENAGTFGSFSFVAVNAYRFPSVESFEDYSYLFDSYKASIMDQIEITDPNDLPDVLEEHYPIVQGIMGIARVQSENLLVSAFDIPNNRWKENGWEQAYERAMTLRAEIDAYADKLAVQEAKRLEAENAGEVYEPEEELQPFDVWWANFLDLNSDFWDPPLPVEGKAPPANSMKDKGRFQGTPMTRNDLKGALGESPYTHFLWDANAVDEIFFNVPEGAVGGPFRCPKGYYISYVKKKVPASRNLSLRDERTTNALQDDYASTAFRAYAHEALRNAEVSGL